MILIHIVSNDENQANEIVDFLTLEKLVVDAVLFEKVTVRKRDKLGVLQNKQQIMIMAKTKALLFNHIDELLQQKYPLNMPVIYSLPILNMDFNQVNELVNETAKV